MKEVEEEGTMESTTLLSKQTKITVIPEKEPDKEIEEVKIMPEKG